MKPPRRPLSPYHCGVCGEGFTERQHREAHKNTAHPHHYRTLRRNLALGWNRRTRQPTPGSPMTPRVTHDPPTHEQIQLPLAEGDDRP